MAPDQDKPTGNVVEPREALAYYQQQAVRSAEEVQSDVREALSRQDPRVLSRLADELEPYTDGRSQAMRHHARAAVCWLTGSYDTAMTHLSSSLTLWQEIGDKGREASVMGGIGSVKFMTGDFDAALSAFKAAIDIQHELGERKLEAQLYGNLGAVYSTTGNYTAAVEQYRHAYAMFDDLGDELNKAKTIGNIGVIHADIGDHQGALQHSRTALEIYERHGYTAGLGYVTMNAGDSLSSLGQYDEAITFYERSLDFKRQLDDSAGALWVESALGLALIESGRVDEARERLSDFFRAQIDDPKVQFNRHYLQALLAQHGADLDEAHRSASDALAVTDEYDLLAERVDAHELLRDIAEQRGRLDDYVRHNKAWLELHREVTGDEARMTMAVQEKERELDSERRSVERHKALLYGALPPMIADRMLRGEDVSSDYHERVAVLFLDVAGFTTHSSSLEPHQVTSLLADIFREFDQIAEETAIIKIKTIGDAYMAVAFELSEHDPTPEQRLAAAATRMMRSTFAWPQGDAVSFRIGLHSGPVVAGVIGTQRLQYDVWGDTVNTASRMESTGEPGRIQVSAQFATALGNGESGMRNAFEARVIPSASEEPHSPFPITYSLTERGVVNIKGKGSMTTYWLEPVD